MSGFLPRSRNTKNWSMENSFPPGNTPEHIDLQFETRRTLQDFVAAHQLGRVTHEQEFDFGGSTHAPDVSFFGIDKVPLVDRRMRVQRFVPDLAIEITSDSGTDTNLAHKKNRYLRAGVPEVWVISTEGREIRVYTQTSSRLLTGSVVITTDLLPGFSISVEELLRGL